MYAKKTEWAVLLLLTVLLIIILKDSGHAGPSPAAPNDPYYSSKGSMRKGLEDQWALRAIGLLPMSDPKSVWHKIKSGGSPVVVAVIDSGLDYNHEDFPKEHIWVNRAEIPNGKDDDQNGFVDDIWGWNFLDKNNRPYDDNGHGTMVAGIIAAGLNNGTGIAGVVPDVRIMPLKVMDFGGGLHSFEMVEAVHYAVRMGAKVINLSTSGKTGTKREQEAVDYARKHGVVVVAAAGNMGEDVEEYYPAALDGVICVAATSWDDMQPTFSNFGDNVDLAAPGVEILSLRARGTDTNMSTAVGQGYKQGMAIVGKDKKYYYGSGTSLAAPFVTAAAAILIGQNPKLTPEQVERILVYSARDVQMPGWDSASGNGCLDLKSALETSPDYFYTVRIGGMVPEGNKMKVGGTAEGSDFKKYTLEIGHGKMPKEFKVVKESDKQVRNGLLGELNQRDFNKGGVWTIRLVIHEKSGKKREHRKYLNLG